MPRIRPAKRNLVRWSDDLDKGVLLCVQYACAEGGCKIPWGRVAELMGPTFSEGSIVQHLAKLRNLMAKHDMTVPPPMKRGMVTKEPSKIYSNPTKKRKLDEIDPKEALALVAKPASPAAAKSATDTGPPEKKSIYDKPKRGKKEQEKAKPNPKPKARAKPKAKGKRNASEDEEGDITVPELYDSDDAFVPPVKKPRGRAAKKQVDAKATPVTTPATAVSAASPAVTQGSENMTSEAELPDSPGSRTRGIRRDYTEMVAASDDEDDEEDFDAAGEGSESYDAIEEVGWEDEESVSAATVQGTEDMSVSADFGGAANLPSSAPIPHVAANANYDPFMLGSFGHAQMNMMLMTPNAQPGFLHGINQISGYGPQTHVDPGNFFGMGTAGGFGNGQFPISPTAVKNGFQREFPMAPFPGVGPYTSASSTGSSKPSSSESDAASKLAAAMPSMSDDDFLGLGSMTGALGPVDESIEMNGGMMDDVLSKDETGFNMDDFFIDA